jgi:quinol monooxygenase YgiN
MTLQFAPDHGRLTALVEFDIEPEEQEPLRQALSAVVPDVLCRQPGLISVHVLVSRDGRKLLTHLDWTSLETFETFRDDEDEQRWIRALLGPYGPRMRVYDIVLAALGPPTPEREEARCRHREPDEGRGCAS